MFERIKSLSGFLNEAQEEVIKKPYKLVILTAKAKNNDTAKVISDAAKVAGMVSKVVDVNQTSLISEGDDLFLLNKEDKTKFPIDRTDTVILSRRGAIANTYSRNLLHNLEKHNFFCINTLESMEICENKFLTTQALEAAGLPTPKTALAPSVEALDDAVKAVGGKFPVVVKLLSGTQGIGVSIVDSMSSLKSVYQTFKKLSAKSEILVQEKIESDHDLRIQVLIKKFNPAKPDPDNAVVIGAMRRNVIKGDFRTNYSLGGTVESADVTPEIEKIAIEAAQIVGCNWCGVDIIIDKKTKKPYILEVNSSPGTSGMISVNGNTIIESIINYVKSKKNWSFPKLEIGFRELIYVPGVGEMVAKFDTGNGSRACSMHADEVKYEDGKIIWSLNDKEYTNDIVDVSTTEVGSKTEERPFTRMSIWFADKEIRDVPVAIVDRTEKSTPFLANRNFMEKMGTIVNPDKVFVVTKSPATYDASSAKGNPHAGIKFEK